MTTKFSLKSIPLAATLAAALFMGGAVHAQGAGASGAGTNAVQSGASPAPGTTGAEVSTSKAVVTPPTRATEVKPIAKTKVKTKVKAKRHAKYKRMATSSTTQSTPPLGPKEDPARIKP
ncbi:MAG: hypothetical protein H7224_09095 [Polaromonas sp.]|nr:hypothetical protein [Polaromonas sp.]